MKCKSPSHSVTRFTKRGLHWVQSWSKPSPVKTESLQRHPFHLWPSAFCRLWHMATGRCFTNMTLMLYLLSIVMAGTFCCGASLFCAQGLDVWLGRAGGGQGGFEWFHPWDSSRGINKSVTFPNSALAVLTYKPVRHVQPIAGRFKGHKRSRLIFLAAHRTEKPWRQ